MNDLFNVGFFLWGHAGPDLHKEYNLYMQELDKEWTLIDCSSDRRSYAAAVQSPRVFSFDDPTPEAHNPPVLPALKHLLQTRHASNLTLTFPNNTALGRVGSRAIQTSRPANRVSQAHGSQANFYVCCPSSGHLWPKCTSRIRCSGCRRLGHIRGNCQFGSEVNVPASSIRNAPQSPHPPLAVSCDNRLSTMLDATIRATVPPLDQSNHFDECITIPAASLSHHPPPPMLQLSPLPPEGSPVSAAALSMASFLFDPAPFLPASCNAIEFEG